MKRYVGTTVWTWYDADMKAMQAHSLCTVDAVSKEEAIGKLTVDRPETVGKYATLASVIVQPLDELT